MGVYPEHELVRTDGPARGDTRFGGRPDFIQDNEPPTCCGGPVPLFARLDGRDFPEARTADGGRVYVFLCPRCFTPHALFDCF